MMRILNFLNPLARLGVKKYSVWFPIILNLTVCIFSELYAYLIAKDPNIVGTYIIFINVGVIIYFSFRDGIRAGFISSIITVLYYLYIIQTRHFTGSQWDSGVETTFILMFLYLLLSATIGYLKQRIDQLIIQEMEARQLAEDGKLRLETILQQLPVGVLLVDSKGKKLEGNKHLEKIMGKAIKGSLERNNNYQSPKAFKEGKALFAKEWPLVRALNNGEVISGEELEFLREDKKNYFLRINAAPIRNKDKQIIAAVSTIDDITPEKELEQRKEDFVNMASHELKTPITSMKIYIEVLLSQIKNFHDPKVTKTLTSIKSQTERLQELVSDLLDMSRIQTGKLHFNKQEFRLDELIEETAEILQKTTKQHQIIFKGEKLVVNADKFRIYQVVTNLITNAIKYSPNGKHIKIQLKKSNSKAVVSVKDEGIGISKEQQKKIFERLYQVTDTHGRSFPGLGMGLYISKEIIKRHRGAIWVEGEKDKGSTFFFTLPIK